MAKKKRKKKKLDKNAIALLLIAAVAIVVITIGPQLLPGILPGSFTFAELQPIHVEQNGQVLDLDQRSWLHNQDITGSFFINGWGAQDGYITTMCGTQTFPCDMALRYGQSFAHYYGNKLVTYANGQRAAPDIPVFPTQSIYPQGVSKTVGLAIDLPNEVQNEGGYIELEFVYEFEKYSSTRNYETIGGTQYGPTVPDPEHRNRTFTPADYTGRFETENFHVNNYQYNVEVVADDVEDPLLTIPRVLTTIYIEPADCTSASYVTYEQIGKEGETFRVDPQNPNEVAFAVSDPIFCHTAPILKMYVDSNQVFEQSNIEYDSLNEGGFVTVPEGELWILFYKGESGINDVLLCQDGGGYWNQTENRCELPPTLWYICNGVLTQEEECIVQATDYRCEDPRAILEILPGGDYQCVIYFNETDYYCTDPDAQLVLDDNGQYVCVIYIEQIDYSCPEGTTLQIINGQPACVFEPGVEVECPEGTTLQMIDDQYACIFEPGVEVQCPPGTTLQTINGMQACIFEPGVTIQCPEGTTLQIINGLQACVFEPEVTIQCPEGTTLQIINGLQACVLEPGVTVQCPAGTTLQTFNGFQACIFEPALSVECPVGFTPETLSDGTFRCVQQPESTFVCPAGAVLETLEDGIPRCVFEPDSFCTGEWVDGECVIQSGPYTGTVPGAVDPIYIVIIALIIGGFAWLIFVKR